MLKGSGDRPYFSATPADDRDGAIEGDDVDKVFMKIWKRVQRMNRDFFSGGAKGEEGKDVNMPVMRWDVGNCGKIHGLNAPHFFGFGLRPIQELLENHDDAKFLGVPLREDSVRLAT